MRQKVQKNASILQGKKSKNCINCGFNLLVFSLPSQQLKYDVKKPLNTAASTET